MQANRGCCSPIATTYTLPDWCTVCHHSTPATNSFKHALPTGGRHYSCTQHQDWAAAVALSSAKAAANECHAAKHYDKAVLACRCVLSGMQRILCVECAEMMTKQRGTFLFSACHCCPLHSSRQVVLCQSALPVTAAHLCCPLPSNLWRKLCLSALPVVCCMSLLLLAVQDATVIAEQL